ncbi:hypothetical protein MUN82_16140 [Hymenobacter aerilatus]|uniref:Uncharacterized protein n=1 Tax=Hymenobacter aerilatus TaxID=2932251 RepID=A0A8T9STZ4_9BACT|nr:hypothetical protein [Hymenobacter aerilatus]UOR04464.1 hypothetical protein MUN82_16140 [Hymenobacter aerilatus]
MTFSRRIAVLLTGLFLSAALTHAQTQLGQPTLDEQKAQIWCAAIKFVYDDTGRPNLKSKMNCGGSLKQLENSIKADSQKVYSLLYQPLEGRGTMYKGLGSDKSRLQKLRDEIINKLKASPSRKGSPARMQAVDALAASLTSYVENGTPPGDVSSLNAEATPDTSTDEATAAAPADAGPEENPNYATPAPTGNKEGVMSSLFAPIAFIVALLSLVLFWLLRSSMRDLNARMDRHRDELEKLKSAGQSVSTSSGGTFSSKRLTPELRAEIERIVQQRVAEELGQAGPESSESPESPRVETLGYAAVPEKTPPPTERPPVADNRFVAQGFNPGKPATPALAPPTPAPTTTTEAPAPAASSFENIASAPSAYSPPAAPHLETPIPAGPPSAASRDEFDSLVPPVQLPAPESYASVAAAPASVRYVYAKVPVNGTFNEYDLQEDPQHDSIYEITLDANKPDTATFQVNPDPSVHAYAIQSAQYSLRDACRYPQPGGPVSYIINDEPGTLRKQGGAWQIEQKAVVHFE